MMLLEWRDDLLKVSGLVPVCSICGSCVLAQVRGTGIGQASRLRPNGHRFGLSLMLSYKCAVTSHVTGVAALLPRNKQWYKE